MPSTWIFLLLCCTVALTLGAVTKKENERVVEAKLSDEEPGSKEYDHEAFLGENESQTFDKLPPEESKKRLGKIYNNIDADGNGEVTEEELVHWIKATHEKYLSENTKSEFDSHDANQDEKLDWDEYYKLNFGYLRDEDWDAGEEDGFSYKHMLVKDQKRWKAADEDGDNILVQSEYRAFLHPEEYDRMKDVVLDETLEDMDKDGDGELSLEEYIGDMYRPEDKEGEQEPEWVQTERDQFKNHRDKDKSGKLNREEVKEWILPSDYDHAKAEAAHLIYESDEDRDGAVSKEEMMENYSVYVGSQATQYGELLNQHDEF